GARQLQRRRLAASAPGAVRRGAGAALRRRVGMDRERLRAVSGLSRARRRPRRVQRQVHGQTAGAARRLVRDAAGTRAPELPPLLICEHPLAVRRGVPGGRSIKSAISFYDELRADPDLLAELVAGLGESPPRISPKFFYDEHGSELFARITQLPEYYPTRTEIGILRECAAEVAARTPAGAV